MAKRLFRCKFREVSGDLLSDFLYNLNKRNKENLSSLSQCSGAFKDQRVVEYIFVITRELRLDPLVGYHAVELLERFMVKHLRDFFAAHSPHGDHSGSHESAFDRMKQTFPIILISCLQLASKLSLHSQTVNNTAAVRFLHSVGHSVSTKELFDTEIRILKALEFRLNVPNPLTYTEILLEVLGHNEAFFPVERFHGACHHVLQVVSLQRASVYDALLKITTQCVRPSREQREKFVTVPEDLMLLGVAVIAVAAFILCFEKWEQVVKELSQITGITEATIKDFAQVILMHVVGSSTITV